MLNYSSCYTQKASGHHRMDRLLKVKGEDKCYIAQREFERLKELQKKEIEQSEQIVDHLKVNCLE